MPTVVGDAGDLDVDLEAEGDRLSVVKPTPRMHEEAKTRPTSDARGHASAVVQALESDEELAGPRR